jgi:hypothetical protein
MHKIITKENVLNESYLEYLHKTTSSNNFPWHFLIDSANNIKGSLSLEKNYSWSHILFRDGQETSYTYNLFYPAVLQIFECLNLKNKKIIRLRLGMTTAYNEKLIHNSHTDFQFKHETILLYLNDSDGNTIFYDKKNKIIQEVEPKKNKIVYFDGLIPHSSSKPYKNTYRIVLNINITDI